MHHAVFGINSQIHSVSLASNLSTHPLQPVAAILFHCSVWRSWFCLNFVSFVKFKQIHQSRYYRCHSQHGVMLIWKNRYVSECPDNISLYHNASSYSTPSPLYNVGLFFNRTTAIGFECIYETIYDPTTNFTWTVSHDGARVHASEGSRYLEYYFANAGEYVVRCYAGYPIPNCLPCNRTTSVPIILDGTFDLVWLWNILAIITH